MSRNNLQDTKIEKYIKVSLLFTTEALHMNILLHKV